MIAARFPAVVFSRDRAAQLDLLLTSLARNGAGCVAPVHVLWRASEDGFERAYTLCAAAHPEVRFVRESHLAAQVCELLAGEGPIVFFTDDSILFRPLGARRCAPQSWLELEDVLCFSLRLGRNCGFCYPLDRPQQLPAFEQRDADTVSWRWRGADGDFGYPGSLDGHVFRKADLRLLLTGVEFGNPNTLEGELARRVAASGRETMACYGESHLVGTPVNRVNETHPNRFGEMWPYATGVLNERYLCGARLGLERLPFETVSGAHAELPLRFDPFPA